MAQDELQFQNLITSLSFFRDSFAAILYLIYILHLISFTCPKKKGINFKMISHVGTVCKILRFVLFLLLKILSQGVYKIVQSIILFLISI